MAQHYAGYILVSHEYWVNSEVSNTNTHIRHDMPKEVILDLGNWQLPQEIGGFW